MYIFSQFKNENYSTPELRNILITISNLKREISEYSQSTNNSLTYNRIIKRVDDLEQSIYRYGKQLNQLDQALSAATSKKLTEKQRIILNWLKTRYEDDEVYTNLIKQLSQELDIPESTVRWNLRGLRDAELIDAGTKNNKGIPVKLTIIGNIMAKYTST